MILDEIADYTRKRVEADINNMSRDKMMETAHSFNSKLPAFAFENALKKQDINFICEVKKASPSKGVIAEEFPYMDIAAEYEKAGAACISCFT